MQLCRMNHQEGRREAIGKVKYFITKIQYKQLRADLSPENLKRYKLGWNTTSDYCQDHLSFMESQLSGEGYKIRIEKFSEATTEGAQRKKRGSESL